MSFLGEKQQAGKRGLGHQKSCSSKCRKSAIVSTNGEAVSSTVSNTDVDQPAEAESLLASVDVAAWSQIQH